MYQAVLFKPYLRIFQWVWWRDFTWTSIWTRKSFCSSFFNSFLILSVSPCSAI